MSVEDYLEQSKKINKNTRNILLSAIGLLLIGVLTMSGKMIGTDAKQNEQLKSVMHYEHFMEWQSNFTKSLALQEKKLELVEQRLDLSTMDHIDSDRIATIEEKIKSIEKQINIIQRNIFTILQEYERKTRGEVVGVTYDDLMSL